MHKRASGKHCGVVKWGSRGRHRRSGSEIVREKNPLISSLKDLERMKNNVHEPSLPYVLKNENFFIVFTFFDKSY